jgi:hypothetical protein
MQVHHEIDLQMFMSFPMFGSRILWKPYQVESWSDSIVALLSGVPRPAR